MPTKMSYAQWISRTGCGQRWGKLMAVDSTLNDYDRFPTEEHRLKLQKALEDLTDERDAPKPSSQKFPPNLNTAIEELRRQVFTLKEELLLKGQKRVKTQIYGGYVKQTDVREFNKLTKTSITVFGHVGDSDAILGKIAEEIQSGEDCRISYGPIKTLESASRKVTDDYGGDWYQVKDAVRVTVIATNHGQLTGVNPDDLAAIGRKIRLVCVPSRGLSIIKDEETTVDSKNNECGYSGLNFAVRLTTGWPGEIQANIPAIMYGKMSQKDLCKLFGQQGYDSVKSELDIEGGISHVFYEIWRVDKKGRNGMVAAKLSRRYHDYLRDPRGRQGDKGPLKAEIAAFKNANRAKFTEGH